MVLFPIRMWTLNHIVAPHGITDIVHAHVHKQFPALVSIYGGSTAAGWWMHTSHHDVCLYSLFGILSVVHFRHDFVYPKWMLSSMTLALMLQPSQIDALLFYMVAWHVPNHYRSAWPYIKKEKLLTFGLLWAASTWSEWYLMGALMYQPYFIVSIVMGHVVYQEYATKKNSLK